MSVAYVTADRESLLAFFADPGKFYNSDLSYFGLWEY
jgi:hypothetical protein